MPDPFTPEQIEALGGIIEKQIGPAVNNMFTARLGTVEKKLSQQFKDTTESFSKTLDEKLAALKPASADPEPEGGKGGKRGKEDPELATLRAQLQTLAQQSQQATEKAALLRERDRERNARDQVRSHLSKVGIDGDRFEGAYALLKAQGKIKLSEDIDSDDVFFAGTTGEVALEVGLGEFLKSDIAKIYMPPSNTRGAGTRPGAKAPTGQPLTPDQIRANIAAELERELGR